MPFLFDIPARSAPFLKVSGGVDLGKWRGGREKAEGRRKGDYIVVGV